MTETYQLLIGGELTDASSGETFDSIDPSTGEPFATVDGIKMAKKKMFFSSSRASAELGYAPRPSRQAIADAVAWFAANGYLR